LQREFAPAQLTELRELAGGKSFPDLAGDLMRAVDPDAQIAAAKQLPGVTGQPTPAQIQTAAEQLAQSAVTPFHKAAFRRRILEIRAQNEQTIDRHTIDEVLYSGFDAAAVEKAQAKVKDFRAWIVAHKDELTALQIIYSGTRPLKITLKDLRQLQTAISTPPFAASPTQLWRAFEVTETLKLNEGNNPPARKGEMLADLVSLVRHALHPDLPLLPYAEEVRERYAVWRLEQERRGVKFTFEQEEWLDRMAEHIATSLTIEPDDFQDGWFGQHGSLSRAHALFGERLQPLLAELNESLAA
jgi:type I restriction enzyme R subunit